MVPVSSTATASQTLTVSATGMAAQRTRAALLVENIANSETTRTPDGGPYRRTHGGGMLTNAREIDLRLLGHLRRLSGDAETGSTARQSDGPARRQQGVTRNGIGKSPAAKRAFFDEHDGPTASRRPKRQRETTRPTAEDT